MVSCCLVTLFRELVGFAETAAKTKDENFSGIFKLQAIQWV
jgi:hypothetical protein